MIQANVNPDANQDETGTRRERRAERRRRFVTAREARWAARLARVGYKLSGESGALKPPAKVHLLSGTKGRATQTYVVGVGDEMLERPVLHSQWRKLKRSG